jgi:hypothetical protein
MATAAIETLAISATPSTAAMIQGIRVLGPSVVSVMDSMSQFDAPSNRVEGQVRAQPIG